MKERILQVLADVDANRLIELIEDDIADMATLATDAEITRQFETVQKELEGIMKRWQSEKIKEEVTATLYTMVKNGVLKYE
jgi:hypothetical protein